jgi:hypothetical protein
MNSNSSNFQDYIAFLRDNFGNLVEYLEKAELVGKSSLAELMKINKDLFDEDPFIMFDASMQASKAFSSGIFYH